MTTSPIYTIGHGNDTFADFLRRLQRNDIAMLYDVRRFPGSARLPHFKGTALAQALTKNRILYYFGGDTLGGFRDGGYEAYMREPDFVRGLAHLKQIAPAARTAILCAELDPRRCHRYHIAAHLVHEGTAVYHIMKDGAPLPHSRIQLTGTGDLFGEA